MKTILAPIDFSPATKAVIATASSLARVYEARIVLLHITRPPVIAGDEGTYLTNVADFVGQLERSAVAQLEDIQEKLEGDFVDTDIVHVTGVPVNVIAEQARKLKADFIVIGSHGHTAFYDLVVGSTTAGVVKRAPCPVVVVPPAGSKKQKKKPKAKRRGTRFAAFSAAPRL